MLKTLYLRAVQKLTAVNNRYGRNHKILAMIIVVGVGIVGTYLLTISHADAPYTPDNSSADNADKGNVVMRTDHVLDSFGMNAKVSFGHDTTYGDTPANVQATKDISLGLGPRVYRQKLVVDDTNPTGRAQQKDWVQAMNAKWGTKFHVTLGTVTNDNGFDTTWSDPQLVRDYAKAAIAKGLGQVVSDYKPIAPGQKLSRIIHSIAGPNEVDAAGGAPNRPGSGTGVYWARNARIWQEELYKQVHGRDVPSYATAFAGVPVCGPSTRTTLNVAHALELGTALAGDGSEDLAGNVDCGNVHLYDRTGTTVQNMLASRYIYSKAIGNNRNVPYIYSEAGWNNMTYDYSGRYIGPTTPIPYGSGSGFRRQPPWAVATYMPRAVAQYAKLGYTFMDFELLDDIDIGTSSNSAPAPPNIWNQEHFFGMVQTPSLSPATWLKKPQYYAMARMANLLKDRADPTRPANNPTTALNYVIDGDTSGMKLQQLVTQKADGSWWLLLWREVNVWEPEQNSPNCPSQPAGCELAITPERVGITFDQSRNVKAWQPNDARSDYRGSMDDWSTIPTPGMDQTGSYFKIYLGADLTILRIQ